MEIKSVNAMFRPDFDKIAVHPLQSWSWGEFREKLGQKIIRLGKFNGEKLIAGIQISIHQIPHTPWTIGYCPRGIMLDKEWIEAVKTETKNLIVYLLSSSRMLRIRNRELRIQELITLGLRPGQAPFYPIHFST